MDYSNGTFRTVWFDSNFKRRVSKHDFADFPAALLIVLTRKIPFLNVRVPLRIVRVVRNVRRMIRRRTTDRRTVV